MNGPSSNIITIFLFTVPAFLLTARPSFAHELKKGSDPVDEEGFEVLETGPSKETLDAVNKKYVEDVRPIFRAKCFDCHSTETRFPWYYRLPGARHLIDRDIREARKHIDMTRDFPFEGHHGTAVDNLKALERVVRENRMPLWRYRLLHWRSGLSREEKDAILKWIQESQTIINQP